MQRAFLCLLTALVLENGQVQQHGHGIHQPVVQAVLPAFRVLDPWLPSELGEGLHHTPAVSSPTFLG